MNRISRLIVAFAVVASLSLGIGIVRAALPNSNASSASKLDEKQWKYPHMHHAVQALKDARAELDKAEDIFKGHKEEAKGHVNAALKAIHAGLKEQNDDEDAAMPSLQSGASQLEAEQFPHLSKALEHLQDARTDLKEAVPQFEGHRKDAITEVDAAIAQVKEAIGVK